MKMKNKLSPEKQAKWSVFLLIAFAFPFLVSILSNLYAYRDFNRKYVQIKGLIFH